MRWCGTGFEPALDALITRLGATAWPEAPEGFEHVTPPRAMRMVLRGKLDGPHGQVPVILKWSRQDTLADHVSKHVRGGKGVREGQVLRRLRARGVRAPEPLAFTDEGEDLLLTAYIDGLAPLPPADGAGPDLLEDTAALLALAHTAGLRHDDLHAGNLALRDGAPMLVDLGSARVGAPLSESQRNTALAALTHGLLGHARRTQRLRALRLYMRTAHGGNGKQHARTHVRAIDEKLRSIQRRFRRGRDRRATRDGKHFQLFATEHGASGIRNRDHTTEDWIARAEAWLAGPPDGAVALKADCSVLQVGDVVLKHYEGVAAGRIARPVRAFRMAYALRNRGIPAPTPLLAVAEEGGEGIFAAAWIDAPNLYDFVADGGYEAMELAERRRLLESLGRTLRAMHAAEVTHRDLKAPNILVRKDLSIVIVDLDGARVRRGPVRWARRARDLMRLDASLALPERDRTRILTAYHRVFPTPPEPLDTFAAQIARLSRQKRGPSGAPR